MFQGSFEYLPHPGLGIGTDGEGGDCRRFILKKGSEEQRAAVSRYS